jgi:mono/diheme cytochrome c family protein
MLMPKFVRAVYARQSGRMQNVCGAVLVVFFWAVLPLPLLAQSLQVPKPSPGLMPNPTLGKALYQKNCASCHGQDLKGTSKGPPFLHRVYEPSHHADVAFQLAARNGVRAHHWQFGDMQAVPAVTPDDVAHITAFIRMAQRNAGIN